MLARSDEHRAFVRLKFPASFELFYAVMEGTAEEVRGRLAAGDDPHARGVNGETPLMNAIRFAHDLPKADLLFAAGARVDTADNFGMQPIHWAATFAYYDVSCPAWLIDRGADPSAPIGRSKDKQFYPLGWTPLHIAADRASLPATRFLLERHAAVSARSADGSTPLHVAAGQYRVYKRLIRTLLDAGADIDAADSLGRTPLHVLAGGHGRYRKTAIRLLRNRNARLDARDANGQCPRAVVPDGFPATEAIRRLLTVPTNQQSTGLGESSSPQ